MGIYTLTQFDYDKAEQLQFYKSAEWIKVIKSGYTIGLDGISLPLYFLSMVITVLVMIYKGNQEIDANTHPLLKSLSANLRNPLVINTATLRGVQICQLECDMLLHNRKAGE